MKALTPGMLASLSSWWICPPGRTGHLLLALPKSRQKARTAFYRQELTDYSAFALQNARHKSNEWLLLLWLNSPRAAKHMPSNPPALGAKPMSNKLHAWGLSALRSEPGGAVVESSNLTSRGLSDDCSQLLVAAAKEEFRRRLWSSTTAARVNEAGLGFWLLFADEKSNFSLIGIKKEQTCLH
jgi:hypothetical protein